MLPTNSTILQSTIDRPQIDRSLIEKKWKHKTTFNPGYLIPIVVDEVLPTDTINIEATYFARLQTLKTPMMDNMYLSVHWFYCPNRLLWQNWERFLGARDVHNVETEYLVPIITTTEMEGEFGDFEDLSLSDYFGLPVNTQIGDSDLPIALPYRMYNLIYNEWYRDQNLIDKVVVNLDDGPDDIDDYQLLKRAKQHDVFTTCLPWPQKGDPISLPLGVSAPVVGDGQATGWLGRTGAGTGDGYLGIHDDSGITGYAGWASSGGQAGGTFTRTTTSGDRLMGIHTDPTKSHLIADLSTATAATINELRFAIAVQQLQERMARGGTRYTEILKSQWGATVPDFRLQRPEYLGGVTQHFGLAVVPQQSETATTAQGTLTAYAQLGTKHNIVKTFDEHGFIMAIASVYADITYQNQIRRMWNRRSREQFYNPIFAHLGEEPVYTREVFYTTAAEGAEVFGYQARWYDYKDFQSIVTGKFRSNAVAPIDQWHLALEFSAAPELDQVFIEQNVPTDRIVATQVTTQPHILFDSFFRNRHARPIPLHSIPGLDRL